jgi:hypothetical protein
VIFGSSRGSSSSRNTSTFTSRNSSILIFTTLGVFIGTILIWSSRGIGYYSSRGGRGGIRVVARGGGGRIIGGSRRGIVSRGRRYLFSIVVIKADRISPFVRSTSASSISSYIYIYSSFSLIIANKVWAIIVVPLFY